MRGFPLVGCVMAMRCLQVASVQARHAVAAQTEPDDMQRKLFNLGVSYQTNSPIDLPPFQIQLFPTPGDLQLASKLAVEKSIDDYLTAYFGISYPDLEVDDSSTPQFYSANAQIKGTRPVTSNATRLRKLSIEGTEFDVSAVLRFRDSVFPDYQAMKAIMQDAMANNFSSFLKHFLPTYATPEIQGVDSGYYISGFTNPPSSSPTAAPTAAPTAGTSLSHGSGSLSQSNKSIPVNVKGNGGGINPIYPAIGCGVIVFILTALWLSYRRKRVNDCEMDDWSDIDHVSVDFDGRQEALEVEQERQRKHLEEQERLEQEEQQAIQRNEKAREENSRKRPWNILGRHVQNVPMGDGRTTIHMGSPSNADEAQTQTPIILNAASNMSGASFHDDGRDLTLNPTGSSERDHPREQEWIEEGDEEQNGRRKYNSRKNNRRNRQSEYSEGHVQTVPMADGRTTIHIHADSVSEGDDESDYDLSLNPTESTEDFSSRGQRLPLPSMRRGGVEFGMSR